MHNVLIVGASRGIGLGLADAFLQRGAQVFAVALGDRKALPGCRHWRSGPGSACKR